jgi:aspartyl protease family protein
MIKTPLIVHNFGLILADFERSHLAYCFLSNPMTIKPVIKQLLTLFTLSISLIIFPDSGKAQEHQGCYMLNSSGEQVDLSSLCGNQAPTGIFRVPIKRRQGGIPVIEVTLNEEETVEMMVDTGASATLLSSETAQRLGVKLEGTVLASTPSQRQAQFRAGRVASLNAGGAVAENLRVLISPVLSIGLLGQNFFSRYDVVIKEKVVEFRDR